MKNQLPVLTSIMDDWHSRNVKHQVLTYTDPSTGNAMAYERVTRLAPDKTNATGVIIICHNSKGELLLVDEFRHAVNDVVTTFPTGVIESDETPLRAAIRILLERTGLQAQSVACHAVDWANPVFSDNAVYIVTAKADGDPIPCKSAWDSAEPFWLRSEEIPSLLNNGKWLDARLRLFLMGR